MDPLSSPLLSLSGVSKYFGGLVAVNRVTTHVFAGQIVGLIGPNGAGKTTLFNLVGGVYRPSMGDIAFRDESIVGLEPHQIAERGMTRTFQNVRLFSNMTVLENVMVGCHLRGRSGFIDAGLRRATTRSEEKDMARVAGELLERLGLADRAAERATDLPFGLQRNLEIARALATEPSILLLDEPAAGLNAPERELLLSLIREIRESGTTVVLVEHDMNFVMGLVDELVVLDHGSVIAQGPPAEVQADEQVIAAYLGVSE